jgi:hypothetical protein
VAATESSHAPCRFETDDQYDGTSRCDRVMVLAQLRQVLLAMESPKPAKEHQHDRSTAKTRQRDPLT